VHSDTTLARNGARGNGGCDRGFGVHRLVAGQDVVGERVQCEGDRSESR